MDAEANATAKPSIGSRLRERLGLWRHTDGLFRWAVGIGVILGLPGLFFALTAYYHSATKHDDLPAFWVFAIGVACILGSWVTMLLRH